MIFLTFSRAYPRQSFLMVAALLLAGLAEGSSLSLMLPLISFAVDNESGVEPENQSEFTQWITHALEAIGITPAIGNLLIIVVVFILLKNLMLLVANKQVGYTKARMATDLRLRLLRSILESRWSYFVHQPVGRLTNSMATEAWRASDAYEFGAGMVAYGIQTLVYVVVVPLQSVVIRTREDGSELRGVFTVSAGVARFTPVDTGMIGGLDLEVRGIDAGTEVVAGPYQVLRELEDGDAVSSR